MTQTTTTKPLAKRENIESAIYGLARLVAGYESWKEVDDIPYQEKITALANSARADFSEGFDEADQKAQASLMRKLRAYHQLLQLERFCFDEVEWDD